MNTLIGMPEPTTDYIVEPTRAQLWWDRWLGWLAGVVAALVLLGGAVGTTVWLSQDDEVHLGASPENRFEPVVLNPKAPEFSSNALYLDTKPGDGPVNIISVTPLTTANVEYLGARSIWPSADGPYGNWQIPGRGFPRPQVKESHPITEQIPASEAGYTDEYGNHRSIRLVVGFRMTSGDQGAFNGIEVVYRVGDRTVRQLFRSATLVCFELQHCQNENLQSLRYTSDIDDLGLVRD